VPVVLLSGLYGSSADQALATRVGASALVLRTPDFEHAERAILAALSSNPATPPPEEPTDHLALTHTRLVNHQLEKQLTRLSGLAQRYAVQAVQLSFLAGVADALISQADTQAALRTLFGAALTAAGISKGALILRDTSGQWTLRQHVGFSKSECWTLRDFFGHGALIDRVIADRVTVTVPSAALQDSTTGDILLGAHVVSAQIVPLLSSRNGLGVMVLGATLIDLTNEDSVAFGQALGSQIVRALELSRFGWPSTSV
jgi:transcriptional regulator with GAF, ATPase, and Fis domain